MRLKSEHIMDAIGVAGAVLLAVGSGMIYLPAGLIVAGSLMLAAAVLRAWKAP